MKIIYLLISCMILPFVCHAQQNQGIVIYEQEVTFDWSKMPEGIGDEIKETFAKHAEEMKQRFILTFNEKESLYKTFTHDTLPQSRFSGMGFGSEFYKNSEDDYQLERQNFLGKSFLIEGKDSEDWKVTGKMAEIEGYRCIQAKSKIDTLEVTAWFAPQIPVSDGPNGTGGLPGLILSVQYGRFFLKATKVDLRPLKPEEEEGIAPPTKGKKVTRKEYKEIVEKKMKEMQEMHGGRGIIIQGN